MVLSEYVRRQAVLAVLLGVLHSAGTLAQTTKPAIYDTGYEIPQPIAIPPLHWIDNDRLLFVGMKAGRGPRPDLSALHLWSAASKTVSFYANAKSVCVVDGVVRYPVRAEAARQRRAHKGPLGSEREIDEPLLSQEEIRLAPPIYSNFTCENHLRRNLVPPAQRFNHVVVLRHGDGYLDLEPGGGADLLERLRAPKKNIVLYQASGKTLELPMTWDEQFAEYRVTFSAYRRAYVLSPGAPRGAPLGIVGPWPKDVPFVTYLLWPDGRFETTSIPYSSVPTGTGGLGSPRPTKSGWIFGAGHFYRSLGLYLFNGKTAVKLDAGAERDITVSPDGCKAAVAIQNDHLNMGTPTNLRIVDLCREGR